jgi:hypothetical protein
VADAIVGDAGADDIRLKMWLAANDLVGCGPIMARLRSATRGLASIREDDFPEDARPRAMQQYRLGRLAIEPQARAEGQGLAELAEHFLCPSIGVPNPSQCRALS